MDTRLAILLLLNAAVLFLLSAPALVNSADREEDNLLQGINSFRQSATTPPLSKHDKADCVAGRIADQLEDQRCGSNNTAVQPISNYPDVVRKCKIDPNTTGDGMVLPVCVPHRVPVLVLTYYTAPQNVRYLNDSRFTAAGIGTEDDWTVVVLTSFAMSRACRHLSSHDVLSLVFVAFVLMLDYVFYCFIN